MSKASSKNRKQLLNDNKILAQTLVSLKSENICMERELDSLKLQLSEGGNVKRKFEKMKSPKKKRKETKSEKKDRSTIEKKIKTNGLSDKDRIFQNLYGDSDPYLSGAMKRGDWKETKKYLEKSASDIINEIKESGLRGRGGAGFPAGLKASFMPKPDNDDPNYLVINADESEPGTCKDREIIRNEPHKLIEGAVLMGHAVKANIGYIYIRGEFFNEYKILKRAIEECYTSGYLGEDVCETGFTFNLYIHRGSGSYICGEETALLESLEGKPGKPRLKPPYPAQAGLYGKPTAVFNVETIAVIPTILKKGSSWFSSIGENKKNCGTKLFCVSGDVNNPLVVEEKMGIPLKWLIEGHAGGVKGGWNNLLAVIPGGGSTPILTKSIAETVKMDFSSMEEVGSLFGTGGVIVWNKDRDICHEMTKLIHFYREESCGKCTVCREGTYTLHETLKRISKGDGDNNDIVTLENIAKSIQGKSFCPFGDAVAGVILSGLLKHFKDELKRKIKK